MARNEQEPTGQEAEIKHKLTHIYIIPRENSIWEREEAVALAVYGAIQEAQALTIPTISIELPPLKRNSFIEIANVVNLIRVRFEEDNVRFGSVGDLKITPKTFQEAVLGLERATRENNGQRLIFVMHGAGKYGIVQAAVRIATAIYAAPPRHDSNITDESFGTLLSKYLPPIPQVDLTLIMNHRGNPNTFRLPGGYILENAYGEYLTTPLSFLEIANGGVILWARNEFFKRKRRLGGLQEV